MRLQSPATEAEVIVDLLFASSGIEAEVIAAAAQLEILPGFIAPVAQIGHLLALKVLAGRPQDLADIDSLRRYADERDLMLARSSCELITRRGYNRGKNLLVELARLV